MALKNFRLQLRFLLPLVAILALTAYVALPAMDRVTLRWFSRDLGSRADLVASTLADSVVEAVEANQAARLRSGRAGRAPGGHRSVFARR
jgi:trehalose 6-phosphate synthase/phosphatase